MLNGVDLNVHFSSMPVMVTKTIALSLSLTLLMPFVLTRNNRFVVKGNSQRSVTTHRATAIHSMLRGDADA